MLSVQRRPMWNPICGSVRLSPPDARGVKPKRGYLEEERISDAYTIQEGRDVHSENHLGCENHRKDADKDGHHRSGERPYARLGLLSF